VQPSVAEVAPPTTGAAYFPGRQFVLEHVIAGPPADHVLVVHAVQFSVALVAPPTVAAAYDPAAQVMFEHDVKAPPADHVP